VKPQAHSETLLHVEWTLAIMNNVRISLRKRRHYWCKTRPLYDTREK